MSSGTGTAATSGKKAVHVKVGVYGGACVFGSFVRFVCIAFWLVVVEISSCVLTVQKFTYKPTTNSASPSKRGLLWITR